MQCSISLSIYRVPGHLIFQLHCEFFNTSGTIPVKVCFWQVIFLSNWLLSRCRLGIVCRFASISQLIFCHSWRLTCFLEAKKNRFPFPYPQRELSIAPWEELWLIWHGSIVFLLIWDLRLWFIATSYGKQFLARLISLSYVPASSQVADPFPKSLSGPSHHTVLGKLGISPCPSNLRGWRGEDENGMLYSSVSASAFCEDDVPGEF